MTENRRRYLCHLKSRYWRQIKKARKALDNHQCTQCSSTEDLTVHHITYERLGKEDINDLITLCKVCHVNIHKIMRKENVKKY